MTRLSLVIACCVLAAVTPAFAAACPTWSSVQQISVPAGTTTSLNLRNCYYSNINLFFYCEPQSTLIISGLSLVGGQLSIVGPTILAGNMTDVAVFVYDSLVLTNKGSAVGVLAGYGANVTVATNPGMPYSALFLVQNVTLQASNSVLVSTSESALALGFGLSEEAYSAATTFQGVTINVDDSTVSAHGYAASAAGFSWGYRDILFVSLTIDGFSARVRRSTVNATSECTVNNFVQVPISAAVGIASTGLTGPISVQGLNLSFTDSTIRAVAMVSDKCDNNAVAAAGGIAVSEFFGGALQVYDSTASAVNCDVSSLVDTAPTVAGGSYASATLGVAIGFVTVGAEFSNVTFYAVLSNVSSNCTTIYAPTIALQGEPTQVAAATCGVSVAQAQYALTFIQVGLGVLWSTASSVAALVDNQVGSGAASSVGGVALANFAFTVDGLVYRECDFYVDGNVSSQAFLAGGPNCAASAVAAHVQIGQPMPYYTTETVPSTDITTSNFTMAGGVATSKATVLIYNNNISMSRARAAVGAVAAPLLKTEAVHAVVSKANATACASSAYHNTRSGAQGIIDVGRVDNTTNKKRPTHFCETVAQPDVVWDHAPAFLRHWLRPTPTPVPPSEEEGARSLLSQNAAALNGVLVTFVASAATILSSPGSAMQASRAMTIVALGECRFNADAVVYFPTSMWPRFRVVPEARGAYLRGGVVAALMTVIIFGVSVVLAALVVGRASMRDVWHAVSTLRLPGIMIVPVSVTLDGLVTCAIGAALVGGGAPGADAALAVFTLIYLTAVTAAALLDGVKLRPLVSEYTPRSSLLPSTPTGNRLDAYLTGTGQWRARTPATEDEEEGAGSLVCCRIKIPQRVLHKAVGSVYVNYVSNRWWFFVVDMAFTAVVALPKATVPSSRHACTTAAGITMALCLAVAGISAVLRPYVSPAKNTLLLASSGLTFTAAILVVAGLSSSSTPALQGGQALALLGAYLPVGNVALAVYRYIVSAGGRGAPKEDSDGVQLVNTTRHLPESPRTAVFAPSSTIVRTADDVGDGKREPTVAIEDADRIPIIPSASEEQLPSYSFDYSFAALPPEVSMPV